MNSVRTTTLNRLCLCIEVLHVLTNKAERTENWKKNNDKTETNFSCITLNIFFSPFFEHTLPVQQACGELRAYNSNCVYLIRLFFLCTLPRPFALSIHVKNDIHISTLYNIRNKFIASLDESNGEKIQIRLI